MVVGDAAEVLTVGVVPSARRQGLAVRMLADLLAEARRRGAREVFLEVRVDNLPAIVLYEREGFARIGTRRGYAHKSGREAEEMYASELGAFLRAADRVLKPRGKVALIVADSALRRDAIRADRVVERAADESGAFVCIAAASQERPHFHVPTQAVFAKAPRREHVLLLEKRNRRS